MRTTNGITAQSSFYTVTAVAVKDGSPVSTSFTVNRRDTKAAKQTASVMLHVPASKVAVEFELCRHTLVIDCDYAQLTEALSNAGIEFAEK